MWPPGRLLQCRALDWERKMRIAWHVRAYILGKGVTRPESWKKIRMIMMEKFPGAEDFEDQRILGMAPSMNKWMSRVMTELVKVHMKNM